MADRKAFLLRADPALLEALQRWADDELRSVNSQIESSTEETRAQTQALLRLIDRFDRPGGAAAA